MSDEKRFGKFKKLKKEGVRMEEIKRFNEDVKKDNEMLEAVKAIGNDIDKIVEYANSKGYDFTIEDLENKAEAEGELSEDDLDDVSGGTGSYQEDNTVELITGYSTICVSVVASY